MIKIKCLFITIFIVIIVITLIKLMMKRTEGLDGYITEPNDIDNSFERLLIGFDTISYMFPDITNINKKYYEKICENLNYSSDFKSDLTSVKTLKNNFEKTPSNILHYFKEIFDNLKSVNYIKYNIDELINYYNREDISILINDLIEKKDMKKFKENKQMVIFIEKLNKFITFIKTNEYDLDIDILNDIDLNKLDLNNLPNIQTIINTLQSIKPENPREIYTQLDIYFIRLQSIIIKGIIEKEYNLTNNLCISNFNEPLQDIKYSDYVCNEGELCIGYECGKKYGICKTNNIELDDIDIKDLFRKKSVDILNKENISLLINNNLIIGLFNSIKTYEESPKNIEILVKNKMEIEILLDNILNNNINLIKN